MSTSWKTALLWAALLPPAAWAGGYTEGPDLSNDWLAPTPLMLDPGVNRVQGSMGYTGAALDRDFFSTTIPAGFQLTALVLGPDTRVGGCCSFIGLQQGPALTVNPETLVSGAALLGWHLYGTADLGTDILPRIGFPVDKIGFSGPLPAGTYTWWIQELAPSGPFLYQLDFQVAAVPEPATAVLALAGGLLLARRAAGQARRSGLARPVELEGIENPR